MKTILSAAFFMLACAGLLHAQSENAPDFILRQGQDTLFCVITKISRSTTGVVNEIEYIDKSRSAQTIKGREETEKVISMRVAGYLMELLPLHPTSPDGNKRHMEVSGSGKIQLIDYSQMGVSTNNKGSRQVFGSTEVSRYFRVNGKFYILNNKTADDLLVPALNKCAAFKSGFTEKINIRTWDKAVAYYNEHCNE